jgi:hypothetical protein
MLYCQFDQAFSNIGQELVGGIKCLTYATPQVLFVVFKRSLYILVIQQQCALVPGVYHPGDDDEFEQFVGEGS